MLRQLKLKSLECPTCEQPCQPADEVCPHCKNEITVGLDVPATELTQIIEQLRDRLHNNPDDKEAAKDLGRHLYHEAMKLRYDDPAESLSLFEEVVEFLPEHWEARLKVSWLSIRFTKNERAVEVLLPVVESNETTDLQKQRAFTNLSCAENWKEKEANYEDAERYARRGIALDGEGTAKLWENLATSLKNQGKLEEARSAFKQAIKLNPKSLNAVERQASIDRHLKIQRKQEAKATATGAAGSGAAAKPNKFLNLKSPREYFGKKNPTKDFEKI